MATPTVIGTRVNVEAASGLPRPTVMLASAMPGSPQRIGDHTEITPAQPPAQTIIPGTRRQGLRVTPEQLMAAFPGEAKDRLAAVAKLLSQVIVETLSLSDCAQWGVFLQQSYGTLLDKSVQLTRSSTLQHSDRHLKRLLELLREISAAADKEDDRSPWFWHTRKSAIERLGDHEPELTQLSLLLQQSLPELHSMAAEWDTVTHELTQLQEALATHSLGAQYLGEQLTNDPRSAALLRQSAVLLQTQTHISHSASLRHEQGQHFRALAHHIQHTVLSSLPTWMAKVHLLQRAGTPHATQIYAVWQDLHQLLQPHSN